jgi:hypothetical protein
MEHDREKNSVALEMTLIQVMCERDSVLLVGLEDVTEGFHFCIILLEKFACGKPRTAGTFSCSIFKRSCLIQ